MTAPGGVAELSAALAAGESSAAAALRICLQRIERFDAQLGCFLHLSESAEAEANASDARRAQGRALGPLDGVPIALKDNIHAAGQPTTNGIGALRGRAAPGDAECVRQLRAAGAVILGKLNMEEGALGATNDNRAYGRCHNPHRPGFTPGGSSGGSGAAVAAGLCAAALGTDTLGSVRIPASYCGVTGFKPSHGWISCEGVLPLCAELDHVGPLVPRLRDLAPLLPALCGPARGGEAAAALAAGISAPLAKLRLARVAGLGASAMTPEVADAFEQTLQRLRGAGAVIGEVELAVEEWPALRRRGLLLCEAEAARAFAPEIRRNPEGFTPQLRALLDYGAAQSAERIAAARARIAHFRRRACDALAGLDAVLLPTAPQTAFAFDGPTPNDQADFTAFANLAGGPALSLPMGAPGGLPLGLQLAAAPGADAALLRAAARIEALLPAPPPPAL